MEDMGAFYQQILGLESPWEVSEVKVVMEHTRVDVYVDHAPDLRWSCPKCQKRCPVYDHTPERKWRHLDTCQLQTLLHAKIPRVNCPTHGVLHVSVPWAEQKSRFTQLMERVAIDVIKACATLSGACRVLNLSWDEADGIMKRAVARGLRRRKKRAMDYLGVDEKAFKKGHRYMTIISDIGRGVVVDVQEGRDFETLARFYQTMTPAQRTKIKGIGMDMSASYYNATMAYAPDAEPKIVYDRFHIMMHVNKALDQVQRQEHLALLKQGNHHLTGTRAMWRYSEENLPEKYHAKFQVLKQSNLKASRAWALKEQIRQLWDYRYPQNARKFFKDWYYWATHSRLTPMMTVARMIKDRLENIITYCKHQITNGVAEGLNSKIMSIKRRACGYRNPESFKTAIMFHCADLPMYP